MWTSGRHEEERAGRGAAASGSPGEADAQVADPIAAVVQSQHRASPQQFPTWPIVAR
jgi:hypothetical protein